MAIDPTSQCLAQRAITKFLQVGETPAPVLLRPLNHHGAERECSTGLILDALQTRCFLNYSSEVNVRFMLV
jgi:hypothetical protein